VTEAVTITLALTVKPEVADAAAQDLARGASEARDFEGCRSISIYRHKAEADRFVMIEEWDSQGAHGAYMAWRAESGGLDALGDLLAKPPVTNVWTLIAKG
jgi:quinol monooxygenase YgiN